MGVIYLPYKEFHQDKEYNFDGRILPTSLHDIDGLVNKFPWFSMDKRLSFVNSLRRKVGLITLYPFYGPLFVELKGKQKGVFFVTYYSYTLLPRVQYQYSSSHRVVWCLGHDLK